MKRMNTLKGIAVSAMALLTLASCSNEDAGSLLPSAQDRVPLQVSVEDAATRGIITGTTLPDDCSYRIYAYSRNSETNYEALNNQSGSTVKYQKGVSRIDDNPIYLPEDGSDVQVVALYGGITGSYDDLWVNKIKLSEKAQEDYLVGINTNKVNKSNPKANLAFTHVMSRVTLNIRLAKGNTNYYKIPEVTINNLAFDAYMDVREGKPIINGVDNSQNFILPVKIDDYVLDDSAKVITADFLVLPAEQENITVKLDGFSQEIKLPISNFEMGQQYSFNVVIRDGKLTVDGFKITPWSEKEQQDNVVVDGTYKQKASIGDFFYSDGTYSSNYNGKKVIGVVYALTDSKNGDINRKLTESYHGRIVALADAKSPLYGGAYYMSEYKSVNNISNYTIAGEGNTVVNEKGQIVEWPSGGALADFNGLYETQQLEKFNKDNEDAKWEAWYQCVSYSTEGFPQGSWYLPSLGELYLVDKISDSRVKKAFDSKYFKSLFSGYEYYHTDYWSSTQVNADEAWMICGRYHTPTKSAKKGHDGFAQIRPVTTF